VENIFKLIEAFDYNFFLTTRSLDNTGLNGRELSESYIKNYENSKATEILNNFYPKTHHC
jgi:hypothetical protein